MTPTLLGEMIYDVVFYSIRSLLNPELTASWEKGLNYVANGEITDKEYMEKLTGFVRSRTEGVLALTTSTACGPLFDEAAKYYRRGRKVREEEGVAVRTDKAACGKGGEGMGRQQERRKNEAVGEIRNLFNLEETIAADLFQGLVYPWEALPRIGSFILKLGEGLDPEEYEKEGRMYGSPDRPR